MELESQALIEKIVNDRLQQFTDRLVSVFPDKEYELRKIATGVGRSGLDGVVKCYETLEEPAYARFISREAGTVVTNRGDLPAHLMPLTKRPPEETIATLDFIDQLTDELNKRNDLTIREITKVLEDHVEKLKGLDRVRELAGIKKLHANPSN